MARAYKGTLERRVQMYGEAHLGDAARDGIEISVRLVLLHLYWNPDVSEQMSMAAISRMFGVGSSAIYQLFARHKVATRYSNVTKFERLILDAGYKNIRHFFLASLSGPGKKTFRQLAKELGVDVQTVSRNYRRLVSGPRKRGAVE